MGLLLNMPGFSIFQGSEYARILNIPVLWISEGCEYTIVPNIRGFLLDLRWPLNVPGYLWIVAEYAWLCVIVPECWILVWYYPGWSHKVVICHISKYCKNQFAFILWDALSHIFDRFKMCLRSWGRQCSRFGSVSK